MLQTILGLVAALAAPVTQQVEMLMPPKKGLSPEDQAAYNKQRAQAGVTLAMTGLGIAGIVTGNPALAAVIQAVNDFAVAHQKAANAPTPAQP